jgi:hypothetical protein
LTNTGKKGLQGKVKNPPAATARLTATRQIGPEYVHETTCAYQLIAPKIPAP